VLALPIDAVLDHIGRELARDGALVLEAEPGAGKSTRVPVALLDRGLAGAGEVLVSEPRRLAARLLARHVAGERGEKPGQSIGYSVRFEDVSSPKTRVRYLTEGVLVRRLLDEPELPGVGLVVIDEFHERSLLTDLALALVHRLRSTRRPDLRLVVMSATLAADPVVSFLGRAGRVACEGRTHPLTVEHLERPDDRPLEKQVASAVRRALSESTAGDILVFLPGAAEIRRARDALASLAERTGALVLPLHGNLSLDEQARAVEPASRRKVVLATNVAETSITIDGVTVVVDSGLARVARHSPWSGLPRLDVAKISRASAAQRAGRAGRTRPGRVLRLYTSGDLALRPEHETPEIERADLSEALLTLHGAGLARAADLDWLTPPPDKAVRAAETLLAALGAIGPDGSLSDIGRRMLRLPLHPRLARLVVESENRGVSARGALAAAVLSERDLRSAVRASFGERTGGPSGRGDSDVIELMDLFDHARAARFSPDRLRELGLDVPSVRAVERAFRQIARSCHDRAEPARDLAEEERRVREALLTAYPDRVARRARPGARELVLSGGGSARLSETSVVVDAPYLLAIDVEERGQGRSGAVEVRLASAIDPDWLIEHYADALGEADELVFDPERERVVRVRRLCYGSVVIDESVRAADPSPEASRLLARAALARGASFAGDEELSALLVRIALGAAELPEAGLPVLGEDAALRVIERACTGLTSLAELSQSNPSRSLLASLEPEQQRLLARELPERITLPGGRSLAVHYEPGKPPWVESHLQDFFGTEEGPRICKGRVPLTLHLLAPNHRAVQVTSDLAGFWKRHYPSLRRELMRRYPKHLWPEDGRSATPPKRGVR
jgi:ATP-dependent helicase HrpB